MKGIVSFFIVLILVLLTILPTMVLAALSRPLPAPIEIVINTNDAGPGSLRQALLDVDGGGTVRFGPGLLESTIHLSSTLTVNKSLTIDGESRNVTISGDSDDDGVGNVRVFQIHSANAVTITRLTIEKGASSDLYVGGGGILNGGRLTVIDCTLAKNSAASSGGGIANSSFAKTIVMGSLFFGNSSSQQGGGMYNSGYGDPLTIIDSSFSDNSASGMGGGIFSYSSAITGSTFISNSAAYGGGLHVMGPTTIANSTIISNSVSHWGGGIRNDEQDLPVLVSNSTIAYNRAGINGGGIFGGNSASMSVYNSTISGNSAGAGYGGGIANEVGGTFIVVNTTFLATRLPLGEASLADLSVSCI